MKPKKQTAAIFALASFVSGCLFLNKTITGNTIITSPNSTIIPSIGFLLIFCALILSLYSITKK